jgi:hypothetical protein
MCGGRGWLGVLQLLYVSDTPPHPPGRCAKCSVAEAAGMHGVVDARTCLIVSLDLLFPCSCLELIV